MTSPHFSLDGSGPPLHFLHANGYPPACYQPLLDLFRQHYHTFGMLLRPLWPDSDPHQVGSWKPFTSDLLTFLGARPNLPVIGVGHSIGAIVTLRAALTDPDQFRALVLLDPVLLVPRLIRLRNLLRLLGPAERLHPRISSALGRRRTFDDLEALFEAYRRYAVFRYFDDASLRAYVRGIVTERPGGGYELAYSPEWEAHIYRTGIWPDLDLWRGLPHLRVPTLIVRGAKSDTFTEEAAQRVRRVESRVRVETLPESTHLLPLERPREVFGMMQEFLSEAQ